MKTLFDLGYLVMSAAPVGVAAVVWCGIESVRDGYRGRRRSQGAGERT